MNHRESGVLSEIFVALGAEVAVEAGVGARASFADAAYHAAGAQVRDDRTVALGEADIEVLKSDIVVPMKKNKDGTSKSVTIDLASKDVIHCFKVLPLRVCQDVIPGLRIPIHFRPTKVGRYQVTCAQLCGDGHARMKGAVKVVDESEWYEWYKAEIEKKKPTGEKPAAVAPSKDEKA